MFGMGMSLVTDDFKHLIERPRGVLLGLFSQMVLLPLVGFLLAWAAPVSPELKVGIILIAACPGGATSNLLSYLVKGDLALSVSLTTINSLLVILTIPLIVNLGLSAFMGQGQSFHLPLGETILQIMLVTVIPVVAGLLFRRRFERMALAVETPLKYIMPVMLLAAMALVIFVEKSDSPPPGKELILILLPFALTLNVAGMFIGYGMGWIGRESHPSRVTIGIEVGLQNSGLAIAVATSEYMLGNPEMALPATIYAMFSFVTTAIFGIIANRKVLSLKSVMEDFRKR